MKANVPWLIAGILGWLYLKNKNATAAAATPATVAGSSASAAATPAILASASAPATWDHAAQGVSIPLEPEQAVAAAIIKAQATPSPVEPIVKPSFLPVSFLSMATRFRSDGDSLLPVDEII